MWTFIANQTNNLGNLLLFVYVSSATMIEIELDREKKNGKKRENH